MSPKTAGTCRCGGIATNSLVVASRYGRWHFEKRPNGGENSNATGGSSMSMIERRADNSGMALAELSAEFMPEAEVTLRLAFWLLDNADAEHADIAIDGAHVLIKAHEQNGRSVEGTCRVRHQDVPRRCRL